MLNAGFLETRAIGLEAKLLVETQRADLRVQADLAQALRPSLVDQRHQQRLAHALATPFAQHSHPADLGPRGQPARADRLVFGIAGDYVLAFGIELVPFRFQRNFLLKHEDRLANAAQVLEIDNVIGRFHAEIKFRKAVHSRVLEARFK